MEADIPWQQIHSLVNALAESFDPTWRQRYRKIGTGFLIVFLMRLCFSRSESGYQIVIDEIWDSMKQSGIPLPQEKPVAASSVCEARKKLDPRIVHEMNREVVDSFLSLNHERFRWKNRRLFIIDGSTLHLPTELKRDGFGRMNPEKHYPQGKVSVLLHAGSGLAVDVILDHKGDERDLAMKHLNSLLPDDVVIYDRGYFGYEIASSHIRKGIDAIFRMPHSGNSVPIQNFINDPAKPIDTVVSIKPPSRQKFAAIKRSTALECHLRLIRYFVNDQEYIIATTIIDPAIKPDEFADVYHERWGIEEHYKASKTILSLETFHAKSLQGVLQEVYTAELLLTISRLIAVETESLLSISKNSEKKAQHLASQFVIQVYSRMRSMNRAIPKIKSSRGAKT